MKISDMKEINIKKAGDLLSNKREIYCWFDENSIVSIGITVGLKNQNS